MSDERQGKISASGAPITYSCAGSRRLIAGLTSKSTPESLEGDAIHAALESDDFTALDEEGQTIAERLKGMVDRSLADWGEIDPIVYREKRMWLLDSEGKPLASAKPDVFAVSRNSKRALCVDYKSGYLPVTKASQNIQLRIQALCGWAEFPTLEEIIACTAQYRFKGKLDAVIYRQKDLEMARAEFDLRLFLSNDPDAALSPGEWCRFCPAAAEGICPAAAAWALTPMGMVEYSKVPITKSNVDEIVRRMMTPEQMAHVRKHKSILENIIDAIDRALKEMPDEKLAELGLKRGKPARGYLLKNAKAAHDLLTGQKLMTDEEFDRCLKVQVGEMEAIVVPRLAETMGLTKKDAKKNLAFLLAPVATEFFRNPSLRAVKESNEGE